MYKQVISVFSLIVFINIWIKFFIFLLGYVWFMKNLSENVMEKNKEEKWKKKKIEKGGKVYRYYFS